MAYRLKPDESIPQGIKRIATEEFESAAEQLKRDNHSGDPAAAIHEARKSVKKLRALLRLVRTELGGAFRSQNLHLRTVGHQLSELRDAGVMVETLDKFQKKYHRPLGPHTLDMIRDELLTRKQQAENQAETGDLFGEVAGALHASANQVEKWPLQTDGFSAVGPGLEEAFRRARKAMGQARKDPRSEIFHQWRKQVKTHWYHVRLLEELSRAAMRAEEKKLKKLETLLGDDHNLTVLRAVVRGIVEQKVAAGPGSYDNRIDLLPGLIDRYRSELHSSALALGERIYEERPRDFRRRIKHLWAAWRA